MGLPNQVDEFEESLLLVEREWFGMNEATHTLATESRGALTPETRGLPKDDATRKMLPVFRGPLMYFPDAFLALADVCKKGNDQHNPGQPLHWAREKSTEQMDTALRHMMDHGMGVPVDTDGAWHLAKAAWRILAELQLTIEKAQGR